MNQIDISYTFGSQTKSTALSVNVTEFDPVFENNSWADIAAACAAGAVPAGWNVGAEKPFAMAGIPYTSVIIGKNHDSLHADDAKYNTAYNGGTNKAALTLMMKECYATTYRMHSSDVNNWRDCEMRGTTLPARIPELPELLRNNIRTVGKLTALDGNSSTIVTTADKLWLLSQVEIWGTNANSKAGEGAQYAHFAAGNSRIKYLSGSAKWWWLRSPHSGNSTYFLDVNSGGNIYYASAGNTGGGVAFGFCM